MLLTTISAASALSAIPPSSTTDASTFDKILEPVWKIYNFVKYIATAVAAVVLVFAGITVMMSGSEVGKRDSAKHTIGYVVLGLIVIWATPFIVSLFAV